MDGADAPGPAACNALTSKAVVCAVFVGVFVAIASVSVALRFLSRHLTRVRLGVDDFLILGALVRTQVWSMRCLRTVHWALTFWAQGLTQQSPQFFQWLLAVATWVPILRAGLGQHQACVAPEQMQLQLQWTLVNNPAWATAVALGKASLVLLYRKIFLSATFRRVALGYLIAIAALWAASLAYFLSACPTFSDNWSLHPMASCRNASAIIAGWGATGALEVAEDVAILILPLPPLLQARLLSSKRQWLAVGGLAALGALTVAAAVLRVVSGLVADYSDFSYNAVDNDMYKLLEPTVMLFVACAPMLRPLWRYWRLGHGASPTMTANHTTGSCSAPSRPRKRESLARYGFSTLDDLTSDDSAGTELGLKEQERDVEMVAARTPHRRSLPRGPGAPAAPVHARPDALARPPAIALAPAEMLEDKDTDRTPGWLAAPQRTAVSWRPAASPIRIEQGQQVTGTVAEAVNVGGRTVRSTWASQDIGTAHGSGVGRGGQRLGEPTRKT